MIVALPSAVSPALGAQGRAGDACESDERPCGWLRGPRGEDLFLFSAARLSETNPNGGRLRGFRLTAYRWNEAFAPPAGVAMGLWLSSVEGGPRVARAAGVDLMVFAGSGPARFGLHGLLGGVHRDLKRRDESGLTAGIGLEVAFWIGRNVQMAATWEVEADRFEVESRSRVGLVVRVAVGAAD